MLSFYAEHTPENDSFMPPLWMIHVENVIAQFFNSNNGAVEVGQNRHGVKNRISGVTA